MSLWHWIVLACAVAFATKWLGYAIPARFLQNPRMTHIAACMTVALLSALTVMNTLAEGSRLVLDARLAALVVAAVALWLRAPFLLVVVLGAASAALLRWLGH
ncbi:AzlD domain-containing protein [Comamonas sp.]|uniref:AzlD domain-containing protein n=1 Tax=Comamonas sp. TaxID=34028 RepID=UPI00289EE4B8|nr:AzlD domain-containing protein [Comamonas sp.]